MTDGERADLRTLVELYRRDDVQFRESRTTRQIGHLPCGQWSDAMDFAEGMKSSIEWLETHLRSCSTEGQEPRT